MIFFNVFVLIVCSFSVVKGHKIKDGWRNGGRPLPYAVSIQFSPHPGTFKHFCTGSLIKRQWILTAASCFDNINSNAQISVLLGTRKTNQYHGQGQFIKVAQKIIHPDYIRGFLQNDIALLELASKAFLNNHVQTISIPRKDVNVEGLEGLAYGWGGRVGPHRRESNKALSAVVSIFPRDACANFFKTIPDGVFCVGGQYFYNAPCGGTHGIPISRWDEVTALTYVVGIASYWPEDCEGPALFTSIMAHRDFIKEHIRRTNEYDDY